MIDSISTLNNNEMNSSTILNNYIKFAKEQFNNDWVKTGYVTGGTLINPMWKINKKINLNIFSHKLVDYDQRVAKKFKDPAYIESGLSWTFSSKGLSQLFKIDYKNSNLYKEAKGYQSLQNYSEYAKTMDQLDISFASTADSIKETIKE